MTIFKIVHATEWDEARATYAGSEKDRADGFLHFSAAEQLAGTLARYYVNARDLLLVAVDEAALGDALRWEASTGGALYPHLYALLPRSAVLWIRPVARDADGSFRLPDLSRDAI